MKYIDMHAHYGRFPGIPLLRFGRDLYKSVNERYGIGAMVLSSTRAIIHDMRGGNAELLAFIADDPDMYGYIVANPLDVEGSEREMRKYAGNKKFVGVKVHETYSYTHISSERMEKLFTMLDGFRLPVKIHTESPEMLAPLAERHRELPIIAAHIGVNSPDVLRRISKCANIYVDFASSVPVDGAVERSVAILGPEKVLFGSDMPIISPCSALGMLMGADIDDSQRELILWKNSAKLFAISPGGCQ